MIDKKMEPYYDIMISIFLGFIAVYLINKLYSCPRVITYTDDKVTQTEVYKGSCSGRCNKM